MIFPPRISAGQRLAQVACGGLFLLWVQVDAAGAGALAGQGLFRWRPFLAPFHSVVLHLPIGFLVLAFVLEIRHWHRPHAETRKVVAGVLALAAASALVTAALGWMRAEAGEYDPRTLALHRWSGSAVTVLASLAVVLQRRTRDDGQAPVVATAYRGTLMTAVLLLVYAGHQGGNLTHGTGYLSRNAPEFVRDLVVQRPPAGEATRDAVQGGSETVQKAQSLLARKCRECHGPEKQKGGYRVDVAELALRGGKSGEAAIRPGDPFHSNLVRLITLPPHDADVMPPEGKSPLTTEEIGEVIRWIADGAEFPKDAGDPSTPVAPGPSTRATGVSHEATQLRDGPTAAVAPASLKQAMLPAGPAPGPGEVTFDHDIVRIFREHCTGCHGVEKQKKGLRLDSLEGVMRGTRNGEQVVVPGRSDLSLIYQRISIPSEDDPADEQMPPVHKRVPLSGAEITLVGRWIDEGAR